MKTIRTNTILLTLTTLSVVSISCTYIKHIANSNRGVASYKVLGLSNEQLEGSSIENAPEIIKNWLSNSMSNLANENIAWSLRRSGEDNIVIDVEVTDFEKTKDSTDTQGNEDESDYVYRPLSMFIHRSIRQHRLGNYFVNMIYKSANLWEKNTGRKLFEIYNIEHPDINTSRSKKDGTSSIYYKYPEEESKEYAKSFWRSRIDIKSLVFNFKINKRVIEADIMLNGNLLEEHPGCIGEIRSTDLSYLYPLSKEDRCTIAYFMGIMTHELGHILLLDHIINANSAMADPIYALDLLNRIKDFFDKKLLHQDDIDAFNEKHNIEED